MSKSAFALGFWPTLEPELEDRFRLSRDTEERQIIFALGVIVAVATIGYLPSDFQIHDAPELFWILAFRGLLLAVGGWMVATSRSGASYEVRDTRAPIWFLCFVIADLSVSYLRPAGYPGVLLIAPVAILGAYVALPIKPKHLAPLAAAEALGALFLSSAANDFDNATVISHAIALTVASVLGIVAVRRIRSTDRRQFVSWHETKLANEELEAAMAEIQTLRGIVPICSSCKNVRDDSGFWEAVEIYISRRSDAEFSHGLCPTCLESFLSEHRAGRQAERTAENPPEDA